MTINDFYKSSGLKQGTSMSSINKRLYNNFVFEHMFIPKMKKSIRLTFDKNEKELIENFSLKKAKAKEKEWNGVDDKKRIKREITGASIEYGLLKFYNMQKFFDDSIVEKSSFKNYPDLLPLDVICDIKGASINNVPLVFKTSRSYMCKTGRHIGKRYHCPNVIGITDNDSVWLLGIASPEILSLCVDDNLMMIAENSTKTGFYGVDDLIDLPKSWDEFKLICAKISTKA